MTRLHEEWIALTITELGDVASSVIDLGNGPRLRDKLDHLAAITEAWLRWSYATTADDKLAIEQALEDAGHGFMREPTTTEAAP